MLPSNLETSEPMEDTDARSTLPSKSPAKQNQIRRLNAEAARAKSEALGNPEMRAEQERREREQAALESARQGVEDALLGSSKTTRRSILAPSLRTNGCSRCLNRPNATL